MTRKRITVITAALALLIAGTVTYATFATKPHTAQDNGQIQQVAAPVLTKYEVGPPTAEELLELVNAERAKAGVAPLQIDERVQKSAQLKADDMAANNYFSHTMPSTGKVLSPEMNELLVSACSKSGENIRWVPYSAATSQAVFDGWYLSEPHINAIRKADYTFTGLAIARTADKYYAVQHFCIAR